MNTQPIRFFHRGRTVQVSAAHPTRTVLDWLREDARCTGTKEGCNEGDCGACTVVVGELESPPGESPRLRLRSANACIQFLPTLNGRALFTVEDLCTIAGGDLHPVQQALVDCHGSQCGFCTPGFVMSLWSLYERHLQRPDGAAAGRPTRQQLADELSGNLCRCTGYRPILDAGQRMFDLPAVPLDRTPVVEALADLQHDGGFDYSAAAAHLPEAVGRIDHFHSPSDLAELAALVERKPAARLLAGGTDVGLWVNKQFRDTGDLIHLGNVPELTRIEERDGYLCIGAAASLEAAWRALARRFEGLTDVWLRFASPPIRNMGTMGGNIANGSPIGDSAPVLMALDALVELRKGTATRRLALNNFYLDYMKNQLADGEFLQRMLVPLPAPADAPATSASPAPGAAEDAARHLRAYKISKRYDSDISAVCAAFAMVLQGGKVDSVRLAFGGMAAIVRRATKTEAVLAGRPWSQESVALARDALALDFTPLSDMRASSAYRLEVAQNLLQRFWLETRSADPLPPHATSVWSVMPHDLTSDD